MVNEKPLNGVKGQILVIVTLMLVALFAMLALVLDGGNLYTQRRSAQLAADAGALAGARANCLGEDVYSAINDYVTNRNDAYLVNWAVDPNNGDVTVDTSITFDTFFLHILGRPQLTTPATATAACSQSTSAYVLPIAWSCRPPSDLGEDDPEGEGEDEDQTCDLNFLDEGDDTCIFGEDPIYIVVDSETIEEDVVCKEDLKDGETEQEGVTYVTCNLDDDEEYELQPISGGNRSWLDLDGGGGGANDLKDWIKEGPGFPIDIHTWFAGQTGVATSVYDTIADYRLDDDVVIPVFDKFCPYGVPSDEPDNLCNDVFDSEPHDGWPYGDIVIETGGSSTDYFHIISFALFDITCVHAGSHKGCDVRDKLVGLGELDKDVKTVEGCFLKNFDPDLGGGQGPVDTGAQVVYLKK